MTLHIFSKYYFMGLLISVYSLVHVAVMEVWESETLRIGRQFSCNIIPYFHRKLGKMCQSLSSAAVVIGALRVKNPS